MPGTANSGQRIPLVAQQNAAGAHSARSDRNRSNPSMGQWGKFSVHAEPVAHVSFSWERAAKLQCIQETPYALSEQCDERSYFTPLAAEAIRKAASLPDPDGTTPKSSLLLAMARALPADGVDLESVLTLQNVQYSQLLKCASPDLSQREPDKQDGYVPETEWENYQAPDSRDASKTKNMAQAPRTEGGRHFIVTNARSWPWTCVLVGTIDLGLNFCEDQDGQGVSAGEIDYGWSLRATRRGKVHCYRSTHKDQDWVISVSVGEINPSTGRLVSWLTRATPTTLPVNCIMLEDKSLMQALFWQINASGAHWPEWDSQSDVPPDDNPLDDIIGKQMSTSVRFQLEQHDGHMAYAFIPPKASEPVWTSVCDFILLKTDGLYQFVEDVGTGYVKIICRSILNDFGNGIVTLKADDVVRTPPLDGYYALDVEVLCQPGTLKSNADVCRLFASAHMRLTTSIMTPDMLRCWITEQEKPKVTSCIVRFGKQHDGKWVSGNCAWHELKLMDHATAHVCVIPQFFKDSILPLPKEDYPRNIIIPQCHVRYVILVNFWTSLMPQFFQNNTMVAKAVFSLGVAGLYATNAWDGETGFGHGFPFGWIYSREGNTGKTEALLAMNSMLGFFHRSPWTGDSTKAAMMERLHQQTNLTVAVDDVVVRSFFATYLYNMSTFRPVYNPTGADRPSSMLATYQDVTKIMEQVFPKEVATVIGEFFLKPKYPVKRRRLR